VARERHVRPLATEKARPHRELLEVDELQANFVAFASHELRTPAPGILDELRPRIFERFGRGDDVQGSGLGLAIARAYAPR